MMKWKYYMGMAVFVLIGYLTFPYIKVEVLTRLYGSEFVDLEKDNYFLADYDFLKVFRYDGSIAQVYYSGGSIDLVTYIKKGDVWEHYTWQTIWSPAGSADDFIWPLWESYPDPPRGRF